MQNQSGASELRERPAWQIRIRDPFIVPIASESLYYMFGTTSLGNEPTIFGVKRHFDCYTSSDLRNWIGPHRVFDPPAGFWGTEDYWAAEVHRYRGRYYLFGSFKAKDRCRGTDILVSATGSPKGPYLPVSDHGPMTPHHWDCLDGTLFVDDAGVPWMVFCHEWVQISNGQICAMPLTPDLSRSAGEPIELFTATQAGWPTAHNGKDYVTDGPFFHRTRWGRLLMLWSSFRDGQYAIGVASSESGKLLGPWRHSHPLLISNNGGHGMLFRDFSGNLLLSLHRPNNAPEERLLIFAVDDLGEELKLGEAL